MKGLSSTGMLLAAGLLGAAFTPSAWPAEPPVAEATVVPTRTPPRLIPSVHDQMWPGFRDREALVYVRIDISATGEPTNVVAAEGGFHEPRFVDAAVRAVRSLRFVPATENGKPVATTASMPVRFRIYGGESEIRGVTREFRKEVVKVQQLIENKDVAGAHFHAQWMLSEKVRLLYEYSALQAVLAQTHARMRNDFEALAASREATARSGMVLEQYEPGGELPRLNGRDFLLDRKGLGTLLRLRFILAAAKGAYLDALRAGADAQALGLLPEEDPLRREFAAIEGRIRSADALTAEAELVADGGWTHELVFRHFSVRDVGMGSLKTVRIECDGKNVEEVYVGGREYHLPPDAHSCKAVFDGQPGTHFRIAEFRTPRS